MIISLSSCSMPKVNTIDIPSQTQITSQSNTTAQTNSNSSLTASEQAVIEYIKNSKKIKYVDGLAYINVTFPDFISFLKVSYSEEIEAIEKVKEEQYVKEFDNGLLLSVRIHEENKMIRSIVINCDEKYSNYDTKKAKEYEKLLTAVATALDDTINENDFIQKTRESFKNIKTDEGESFDMNEFIFSTRFNGNTSGMLIMPRYADYLI